MNNKPKRRLLDFDESDEESNEEDPMKAELKYVKMFFIVSFLSYRFKNEPPVDKDEDPLGLWKTKRLEYPNPILTKPVKKLEVSLRSSNEHTGRTSLQLDGLVAREDFVCQEKV